LDPIRHFELRYQVSDTIQNEPFLQTSFLQARPKKHNSKNTIQKPVLFHKRQLLKEYAGICLSNIVFLGDAACRLHIRLQSNAGHQKTALKVHKIENFFGSEFEFYTISLLVMLKY